MNEIHIKRQLIKFNLYGLLKNLRFFDPFILVYLTQNNVSLTQIGILYAIRETIVYLFEIPSGVIADQFGKKTELIVCFLFYIGSFIFFYIANDFYLFVFAFILFGLGEAFRTGTHKAIIIDFLDIHEIYDEKSKIYGKTRSYSQIGSSLSSVLSIILILFIRDLRLLFALAVIPYILDMLLILSYPKYLNKKVATSFSFKDFKNGAFGLFGLLKSDKNLRGTIGDSSLYNAIFKVVKDYFQIILVPLTVGLVVLRDYDASINSLFIIGLVYAIIYLLSAYASRNAYQFKTKDYNKSLPLFWVILFIISSGIVMFKTDYIYIILLFLGIYIIQNIRKPIMVEKIGDVTNKNYRASVLSVESQLSSIFIIILAPLFGFLFDQYGFTYVFIVVGLISLIMYAATKK